MTVNYAPNIHARGADVGAIARIEAAQRIQAETLRDNIAAALRDPRKRN